MSAVIELKPRDESYVAKAAAFMNAKKPDEAYAVVDEVLRKNPDDAQALTLASDIFKKTKRLPVAYQLAKRATEIRADRPETWCARGHAAQQLWRLDEAESCYRKALQRAQRKDQRALYLNNLASVHLDAGRFAKAEAPAREAMSLDDKASNIRHNLGLSLLAQRRWREAWPLYAASVGGESRIMVKYRNPPEPIWDGEKGKTVVVYGEQGLGDEICAASMLPDVIRDCKKTIIDCDHRVANLFKRSFPRASVHGTRWKPGNWKDEAKTVDASIAGFEVGKFYRNEPGDFPGAPYLVPCPDRAAMWKSLFASKGKPIIGIAWSGGTWHNASQYRQISLADWAPVFKSVNAHWVSLQYRDATKEIEGSPVIQYPYATLTQDYDDTAALVAACDLVIAVQTSVVHLAGALGVPCWSLIPQTSQWRYGEEFTDLPWYRSVKLYRQKDSWTPVVREVADDVAAHF